MGWGTVGGAPGWYGAAANSHAACRLKSCGQSNILPAAEFPVSVPEDLLARPCPCDTVRSTPFAWPSHLRIAATSKRTRVTEGSSESGGCESGG